MTCETLQVLYGIFQMACIIMLPVTIGYGIDRLRAHFAVIDRIVQRVYPS